MGYITFGDGGATVKFTAGMVAFIVLTTVCILMTIALWWFLHRRGGKTPLNTNEQDEETGYIEIDKGLL